MGSRPQVASLLVAVAILAGCMGSPGPASPTPTPSPPAALELVAPRFVEAVDTAPAACAPPAQAGISGSGAPASWADADTDGYPDLLLMCADGLRLHLSENGRLGDAEDDGPLGPASPTGAAWGDVDGDNCLDLFVASRSGPGRLLHNDCGGRFVDTTAGAGLEESPASTSVSWVDFDHDADVDLMLTSVAPGGDVLYANDGAAHFTPAPDIALGGQAVWAGLAWSDLDGDIRPDLVLVGDGSGRVHRNLGDGTLGDNTVRSRLALHGVAVESVDFDADTFPDVAVAAAGGIQLWHNRGDGSFQTQGPLVPAEGVRTLAAGDFNNDGTLDLLVGGATAQLFLNHGNGRFTDASAAVESAGTKPTLAVADFDRDGWLDVLAAAADGTVRLLRSEGVPHAQGIPDAARGWVEVRLKGNQSNAFGLGARLYVLEDGHEFVREARSGGSPGAHDIVMHVGIGRMDGPIDLVDLYWPSGVHQTLTAVESNIVVDVDEECNAIVEGEWGC